jgi:hypothetical protein
MHRSPRIANTDFDIVPQVGSHITIDAWGDKWVKLETDDTEWELCEFRVPAGNGLYHLATNVEVTGCTIQRRTYFKDEFVRVKVTFVADPLDVDGITGERLSYDTVVSGWLLVTEKEKVHNPEKAERNWSKYLAALEKAEADELARLAKQEAEERVAKAQAEYKRLAEERRLADELRAASSRAASLEV